jgi:cytochrome P450
MEFNPFDPEFRANPYPTYAQLREESPVHVMPEMGFAAISRYDDVVSVLKRTDDFSSSAMGINTRTGPQRTVINTDPPDHAHLRGLVNRAFTPKMVADMEPRIRAITRELLASVVERGKFDVVTDLAVPLPVTVIAEILGIETQRRDDFKRWSTSVLQEARGLSEAEAAAMTRDYNELQDYLEAAIAERRARPRGDLISAVVAAEQGDQPLTPDEVLAFTILLLIAGNETTTNLIGNMMLALARHPEQLAAVEADRALNPNVVEEALRYDAPVQFLFRKATRDTEIGGVPIPAGMEVVPMFGSANRDDRRFPDGDAFDVRRNAQGHVAFGHGIHFCLGAPLARIEARVALEEMLACMRGFERADETPLPRVTSLFMRGVTSLPLRCERIKAQAS